MAKVQILGVNVDDLSFKDTVTTILELIRTHKRAFVVTANTEILSLANRDPAYKVILNRANVVTPDGIPLVWAGRLRGHQIQERVTGIDLVWALAKVSEDQDLKVFLVGGPPPQDDEPELAKIAARNLKLIHSNIKIVGATFGFFGELGSEVGVLEEIRKTKPNLIFVAMNPPQQEKWIYRNLSKFPAGSVVMGVGGSFKMISGEIRRAPIWVRKVGLEWLWRTIQEPKRIFRLWNTLTLGLKVMFSKG